VTDVNVFLSDEFAKFSEAIKEIHEEKKQRTQEMKSQYQAFQKEIDGLDAQAKKLVEDWEALKEGEVTKVDPVPSPVQE